MDVSLTLQSALSVCYPSVTHSSWQFSAHSEDSWRRQWRKTSFHSGETPWICRIHLTRIDSFKNRNPGHLRVWKVIVDDDVIQKFSYPLILTQLSSHAMNYIPGWHDTAEHLSFDWHLNLFIPIISQNRVMANVWEVTRWRGGWRRLLLSWLWRSGIDMKIIRLRFIIIQVGEPIFLFFGGGKVWWW